MAPKLEVNCPNRGCGLNKGDVVPAHFHMNDHRAVFSNGTWRLTVEGKANFGGRVENAGKFVRDETVEAPYTFIVKGNERHEFTYLGQKTPPWMEAHLEKMAPQDAAAFRAEYENQPGFLHCVFPDEAK
jgi:hypothetical protein